jgi:hypothetical protein
MMFSTVLGWPREGDSVAEDFWAALQLLVLVAALKNSPSEGLVIGSFSLNHPCATICCSSH